MRYTGFHRAVRHIHRDVRRRWPINFCNQVELDALDALRERRAREGGVKPSYTAAVTKAIALSVAELEGEFPELNAMIGQFLFWRWIRKFEGISGGVAVSREDDQGYDRIFVRVIDQPQKHTLAELTQILHEASTAPAEKLPDYLETTKLYRMPGPVQRLMLYLGTTSPKLHRKYRGTFSLTTVGKMGVDMQTTLPLTTPIQYGFGLIKPRPVVREGQIVAVNTMYLTLTFDRNLLNGRPCAELLTRICERLTRADFAE